MSNRKYEFHVGQRIGSWTIIGEREPWKISILARCDCGTTKPVGIQALTSGHSRSCNRCHHRRRSERFKAERLPEIAARQQRRAEQHLRWHPPIGTTFHWLTTIGEVFLRQNSAGRRDGWVVRVRCRCGTEKDVRMSSLLDGLTTACGCRAKTHAIGKQFPQPSWRPSIVAGDRFGELTVMQTVKRGDTHVWVGCSCGNLRHVSRHRLTRGIVTACWGHRHARTGCPTVAHLRAEVPA